MDTVFAGVRDTIVSYEIMSHLTVNSVYSWIVDVTDDLTKTFASDTSVFRTSSTISSVVQVGNAIPVEYVLYQNYPNPFNASTNIRFGLPFVSKVRIVVYNMLGQRVVDLLDENVGAGYFERSWSAAVASGVYLCRIEAVAISDPAKRFQSVKRMMLVK